MAWRYQPFNRGWETRAQQEGQAGFAYALRRLNEVSHDIRLITWDINDARKRGEFAYMRRLMNYRRGFYKTRKILRKVIKDRSNL